MANQSALKELTIAAKAGNQQALAELRALRQAQRDSARKTEELKLRLFQLTESHWDQTVNILKRWLTKT